MNNKNLDTINLDNLPEAVPENKPQRISIVWLIPLVALIIGLWLGYKAWSEMGPTIKITFKSAQGLDAGKTKIKYKNVEIGTVDHIELSTDMTHVIVTAKMVKSAKAYLTESTRFWIVRARVAAGEVSGLETILSGAYIGIDPATEGSKTTQFTGLEVPPVVTKNLAGRHFYLQSHNLGSLDIGSPVYYQKMNVGNVISYELAEDGQSVMLGIFINAPYDKYVNHDTRFWNASGLDVVLDANGIQLHTESLVTMMIGGIAFENPNGVTPVSPVAEWQEFILYENYQAIAEGSHLQSTSYLLYFTGSVRGLSIGAPVELNGIKLGEVTEINMEYDATSKNVKIPVTVEVQMDRFSPNEDSDTTEYIRANHEELVTGLVQQGLRAQLQTGNYVTGQLFVDLGFHPQAAPAQVNWQSNPPVFPTVPTPMEKISNTIFTIIEKLEQVPLDKLGKQLYQVIDSLAEIMQQMELLSKSLNSTVTPVVITTLQQTEKTLATVENMLNDDSPAQQELTHAMEELSKTLRSVRILADYLAQNPNALIYGKDEQQ